jgi:hypothetical protein
VTCDLTKFDLAEMLRCGKLIRSSMASAASMEAAAQRACEALYGELTTEDGTSPGCALVRCYKTHRYSGLDPDLQSFARTALRGTPTKSSMKCLVLLGTYGTSPEWQSRRRSRGHQAIPLPSVDIVSKAPMIAQLFKELGVPVEHAIEPSTQIVRELAGKTYGVFHVDNAVGSPFIPAQDDFVIPNGIRSVVGCGGAFPNGDLFAVIFFCRVAVSPETADRFRTLALDFKAGFFRFGDNDVFDHPGVSA